MLNQKFTSRVSAIVLPNFMFTELHEKHKAEIFYIMQKLPIIQEIKKDWNNCILMVQFSLCV